MTDLNVIRFSAAGDAQKGLQDWQPVAAEFIASGTPTQRGHEFYSTASGRVSAGVWDSTPHEEIRRPYSVDEFMLLLEGSLELEDAGGKSQTFRAGEAFIIPKGAVVTWKQSEYLCKFFFIHDNPDASPGTGLNVLRVDPSVDLPAVTQQDPALYLSEVPQMGWLTLYQDPAAHFQAGVWDCSPMQRVATTIERAELMHILEGSGSITNADGVEFEFAAGDTFLVPVGMGYQWRNDSYVKKLFSSFTP